MKIKALHYIFSLFFLVLILNLMRMQFIQYEFYKLKSERNRIRPMQLEAPRGLILDRFGRELATNILSFDCYVVPQSSEALNKLFLSVSKIINEKPESLQARYEKGRMGRYRAVMIAEDIGKDAAIRLEELSDSLSGLFIKTKPVRAYPYRASAAHITGYVGAIGPEEFSKTKGLGYKRTDRMGRAGLELAYDSYLRGEHGAAQFEVDAKGRLIRVLSIKERMQGKLMELTLDAEIQKVASEAMGQTQGALVAMELERGGLLALVSKPDYDPNVFVQSKKSQSAIRNILADKHRPLINRVLSGEYPPGSTFKIISGLAGLRSGRIDSNVRYFCPGVFTLKGFKLACWNHSGHGSQNLIEALQHSCNVYFCHLGMTVGIDRLSREAKLFGLGELTGVDLFGESAGLVPEKTWKERVLKQKWYAGETANTVIGQGYLLTTPLQMVRAVGAVATEGKLFTPHIVSRIENIYIGPKKYDQLSIHKEWLRIVKKGLLDVVQSSTGTGRIAASDIVSIAGKTGTAQAPRGDDHAWFVGYAPADNPKVAIAIIMEHAGHGGAVAAPVAKQVFEYMQKNGYFHE